jgi:hypothetical protein
MKKTLLLAVTLFLVTANKIFAQRTCASFEHLQEQMKNDPAFAAKIIEAEKNYDKFRQNISRQNGRPPALLTIPVVVHVVYSTPEQNISDAQVQSQIDVLNEDFTASNPDYNNYDAGYTAVKGDAGIRFCVAQIRHVATGKKSFGANDQVKRTKQGGDDAVDPEHTLNIWVCNLGQNLLGYAQFPGGPANTFGIVILYSAFGRGSQYNLLAAYNLGRTATHEIGHCLGLRHIWGDATCGNDLVDDTPLHNAANFGCPGVGHLSTCTGTPLEMWMDYMDYTDDRCMYFFSDGQVARANFFISTDPQLQTIVNSTACTSGPGNNKLITSNSPVINSTRIGKGDFAVFPTITSGYINIELNAAKNGLVEINIYNQSGIMMVKKNTVVTEGMNTNSMDISALSNGVYILALSQSGQRSVKKLIVQH